MLTVDQKQSDDMTKKRVMLTERKGLSSQKTEKLKNKRTSNKE